MLHRSPPAQHLGLTPYHGVAPPVSIVILTHNESANLAECLRSCAWCDDVHVIDSGSTDDTVAVARSMGAHVHQNSFRSFGQQRNWAIDHLPCKHLWQFHLDADERFTAELVFEILHEIGINGSASDKAGYRVSNRLMFLDCWLRRSANFPAYQVRLVHAKRCRFIDAGHGQRELTGGAIGTLASQYMHFPFNKGLSAWFARHNLYSDQEAVHALKGARERNKLVDLLSNDAMQRRRALKRLSFMLPCRSICRFVYQYVLMGGFLEGAAGLTYCRMLAMYEGWIEQKLRHPDGERSRQLQRAIADFRRQEKGGPVDLREVRYAIRHFKRLVREVVHPRYEADSADMTSVLR